MRSKTFSLALLIIMLLVTVPAYADPITWHFNANLIMVVNNGGTLPFPPDYICGNNSLFTGSFTYDSVPTFETITATDAYWLPYDPPYGNAQYSFVGPSYGAEITLSGVHYHWENLEIHLHLDWTIPAFAVAAGSGGFGLWAERPSGIPSLALPLSPSDLPWLFPEGLMPGYGHMVSDSNPNDLIGFHWGPARVPEPSTFVLLGIGVVGLIGYGWRHGRG